MRGPTSVRSDEASGSGLRIQRIRLGVITSLTVAWAMPRPKARPVRLRERSPASAVVPSGSAGSRATSPPMHGGLRTSFRPCARHRSPERDRPCATSLPRYRRRHRRPCGPRRSDPRVRRYRQERPAAARRSASARSALASNHRCLASAFTGYPVAERVLEQRSFTDFDVGGDDRATYPASAGTESSGTESVDSSANKMP